LYFFIKFGLILAYNWIDELDFLWLGPISTLNEIETEFVIEKNNKHRLLYVGHS
jgi:hypothetical protein